MDPAVVPLLAAVIATVLAVGGLAVAVSKHLDARRRDAWRAAARSLGLEHRDGAPALTPAFAGTRLAATGRSLVVENAAVGERGGARVMLADLLYLTGQGRGTRLHRRTVCVLWRDGLTLPAVWLRGRRLADAVGRWLGGEEIDLPHDEAFSRSFVVQGEDPAAVRALLGPGVRRHLLAAAGPATRVEAGGERLLVDPGRRIPPGEVSALLQEALSLLETLSAVWERRRRRPPAAAAQKST